MTPQRKIIYKPIGGKFKMGGWETFIPVKGKSMTPTMAVHSYGHVTLNEAAVSQFKLYEYPFVVLKINPDEKKIGLMFTQNEKEPGAKKVKIKPGGGVSLMVKSFVEYYKLTDLKLKKFQCEWDAENSMVVGVYSSPD